MLFLGFFPLVAPKPFSSSGASMPDLALIWSHFEAKGASLLSSLLLG